MHEDHVPFLALLVFGWIATACIYRSTKALAAVLGVASLIPLIAAISNSERWKIPLTNELAAIVCSVVAYLFVLVRVLQTKPFLDRRSVSFWVFFVQAFLLVLAVTVLMLGRLAIPT